MSVRTLPWLFAASIAVFGCAKNVALPPEVEAPGDLAVTVDAGVPADLALVMDAAPRPDLWRPVDGGTSGWAMAGHDPQRGASSDVTGPARGAIRWTSAEAFVGPPVVGTDGTIFVSGKNGVSAVSPVDGHVLWSAQVGCGNLALGPDGTVYANACSNVPRLCAIDTALRRSKWCVVTPSDPVVPLVIDRRGTIYSVLGASIVALAPGDGHTLWTAKLPSDGVGAAIAVDGTLVVTNSGGVSALSPFDGHVLWTVTRNANVMFYPSLGLDGSIYIFETADYDRVVALDPANGKERWRYSVAFVLLTDAPAVAADGTLRLAVDNGRLVGLDSNGQPLAMWAPVANGSLGSLALDADGVTYAAGGGDHVYAVSPYGKLRWDLPVGSALVPSPALGPSGALYVMGKDGRLRAIGP